MGGRGLCVWVAAMEGPDIPTWIARLECLQAELKRGPVVTAQQHVKVGYSRNSRIDIGQMSICICRLLLIRNASVHMGRGCLEILKGGDPHKPGTFQTCRDWIQLATGMPISNKYVLGKIIQQVLLQARCSSVVWGSWCLDAGG